MSNPKRDERKVSNTEAAVISDNEKFSVSNTRYFRAGVITFVGAILFLIVAFQLFWYAVTLPLAIYRISQALLAATVALWVMHNSRNPGQKDGKWKFPLIAIACYVGIFLCFNFSGGVWNKIDKLKTVNQARSGADVPRSVGVGGDPGHEDVVILDLPLLLTVDITTGYLYSEEDVCDVRRTGLYEVVDVTSIRGNWYRVDVDYTG